MVNKPILNSSNSVTYKDVRSAIPSIVLNAGEQASRRFIEFFLVSIRNENTRAAYAQAIRQFLEWCEGRGMGLTDISSLAIAAYIERHPGSPPTVNQHLSAIRSLFAWLVEGQVLSSNPGAEVQGVKHR
ncbi:MAG: site-specific integrase, partial [Leptolyngbyaceae cyanobacterium RM2_2_4]|nr:site-specific integrase [Leptolyngbyaceae cyanobacterium RM2_2_4]